MAIKRKDVPVKPKVVTVQSYLGLEGVSGYTQDGFSTTPGISERLIGIEVEVENYQLVQEPKRTWIITDDGSLRNNGIEYITKPIPANIAPAALHNLLDESLSQKCCFSPRTSVHVHVNCLDMPIEKIPTVVLLYAAFEELFYRFTGRSRNKNIFCVPLMDTALLYAISHKQWNVLPGSWSKYSGLNLCPLIEKGTLEFRHMHGTRDVVKLTTWIDLLTKLVDFVFKSDTGWLRKVLYGFNRNTHVPLLLSDIFGETAEKLQYRSFEDIESSVRYMKTGFLDPQKAIELVKERDLTAPFFTTKLQKGI